MVDEHLPVFDFGGVNRGWSKAFMAAIRKATLAQVQLNRQEEIEQALERIDEAANEQEKLLAEVLVSVPREWLARSAPADLNWKDPESLNWVRPDYYGRLLNMVQSGEAFKNDAKN